MGPYTPGPWEVSPDGIIYSGPLKNAVELGFVAQGSDGVPQARANGRLMAAAPELLDALRKLTNEATGFIEYADQATHGITNVRVLQGKIDAARAAIAKAEGRS